MFSQKLLKNYKVYSYLRIDMYNMENFSGGHGSFPVKFYQGLQHCVIIVITDVRTYLQS
jgi:hypothetical protein